MGRGGRLSTVAMREKHSVRKPAHMRNARQGEGKMPLQAKSILTDCNCGNVFQLIGPDDAGEVRRVLPAIADAAA